MKEQVINVMSDRYEALDVIEINDLLELTSPEDLSRLNNVLCELEKDGVVYKTKKDKYILFKNCPSLKAGILSLNKKGFGFLIIKDGEDLLKSNPHSSVYKILDAIDEFSNLKD